MNVSQSNRRMKFETMEKRELLAADIGLNMASNVAPHTVVEAADMDRQPACYLKYKLERSFIKSWSTSGDADDRPTEEVAFYYNKIAFGYDEQGSVDSLGATNGQTTSNTGGGDAGAAVDKVFAIGDQTESQLAYKLKDVIVTSYN